ncbi:MAG: M48 family metallopeptidase [Bacteroidota bacterium]
MIVNKPGYSSSICSGKYNRSSRWALSLAFFFLCSVVSAQNTYQRLQSSGQIPDDFLYSSREKYERQLNEISDNKASVRNAKKQFYQGSYYYVNELLLSGKILYNDPVSQYLNEVVDILLKEDPDLRKQFKIYTVKSPSVNAFTSTDGKIFVNLGLLAQLGNEAQLAYILTHEISHFTRQHALDIFLRKKGVQLKKDQPIKRSDIADILENNNYSQEKESEADMVGLELFLRSPYKKEEAIEVFDILKNAEMPFADIPFDRNFLERKTLIFPDEYYLSEDSLKSSSQEEELEFAYFGTHPSPQKRQRVIREALENSEVKEGKLWVLEKERFTEIQKISRFESCYLYLQRQQYEKAIYCAYSLLKDFPGDPFLEKIVVQSLYGLAKYASVGRLWDVHVDHEEIKGESRQVNHIINKMPDQELCILASLHTWQQHIKYPQDEELILMGRDLLQDLGQFFVDSISWFQIAGDGLYPESNNYIRFAFSDLMKERLFRKELGENLRMGKARSGEGYSRKKAHSEKKAELKGFRLGLQDVVFVNPSFQRIDERKEKTVRYLSSEKAEIIYIELLEKHAKKLGLKHRILSKHSLKKEDEAIFNDLSLLTEWVEEKNRYDQLSLVSINHNHMQSLSKKYGTKYFVWTGGISIAQKRKDKTLFLGGGILFPPALPYSLYYNFSPQHDTFFYTVIYDIEQGSSKLNFPKWIKMKDEFDVLNSISYDLIFQISRRGKRK